MWISEIDINFKNALNRKIEENTIQVRKLKKQLKEKQMFKEIQHKLAVS